MENVRPIELEPITVKIQRCPYIGGAALWWLGMGKQVYELDLYVAYPIRRCNSSCITQRNMTKKVCLYVLTTCINCKFIFKRQHHTMVFVIYFSCSSLDYFAIEWKPQFSRRKIQYIFRSCIISFGKHLYHKMSHMISIKNCLGVLLFVKLQNLVINKCQDIVIKLLLHPI